MNGRYALDTNIVIAFFAKETEVIEKLKTIGRFYVPSVVAGELFFGACKSAKAEQNIKTIKDFIKTTRVLNSDYKTAELYGEIKHALQKKGKPLPENDIWISAIARRNNCAVVSRDEHFHEVDTLKIEKW